MNEARPRQSSAQWVRGRPGVGGPGANQLRRRAPRRRPRAWPCGSVVEGPGLHGVNPTSAHRMQEASSRPWPIGWAAVTWAMMSQPLRRSCGCLAPFLEKKKREREREKKIQVVLSQISKRKKKMDFVQVRESMFFHREHL